MQIPFLDLRAQNEPLRAEILAAINEVIDKSAFAGGPYVSAFEQDFASFCGARHAIGLGSGTEALWLVLLALGIGPGDEVITVPSTFMATAEAITYTGATPVFVDIEEETYTMDPALLAKAITPRTKAIIPVHLFGQTADMDPILEIARNHGLPVIEDACQAHGAVYKGKKAGTLGIAGAFSFYPGKNLGAFGEAGAVVTDDSELKKKIEIFRDHGQAKKYYHDFVGWNCRMDGLQGAILKIKLKHLERGNNLRR
ncbi:MAG: Glutamine--scyllo-inositol transaminase, partial [Verrucomicrobiales bacterium]|nr:Glutamine--scyllo-inositol transaminase [Verrucomicrobiales bacterium]